VPDAQELLRLPISEDQGIRLRIPPETKNGDHAFSLDEIGAIPNVVQFAPTANASNWA
jgi:hypothetical protein